MRVNVYRPFYSRNGLSMSFDPTKPKPTGVPFITRPDDLPDVLPIFPLAGVLLLPGGRLPLNIINIQLMRLRNNAI